MSSVIISGDTSGAITLSAPAVAGTNTITLPAQTATIATLTTPSFATTIGVGGATASASGSGITFPATQSASSDANTLDDYEEGTFTPTAASGFTTISGTPAYSGTYTKIGNLVTIRIRQTTGTITWTAGANFTGLPFAPDVTLGGAGSATNGQPDYSSSVLAYRTGGGAGQIYLTVARATNNTDLVITATYFI